MKCVGAKALCCLLGFVAVADAGRARSADDKVEVVGVVFTGGGKYGDFSWMIERTAYRDALFVFDDNEAQYRAPRRWECNRSSIPMSHSCKSGRYSNRSRL
ncbi:hypothetical protein ABIA45_003943 [Bradyrhizobium sp. USDA 336]